MLVIHTSLNAQTAISTINVSTSAGTTTTTLVTSPNDAGNSILDNTQYNINYGQGNNVAVTSYVVSGITYDRFLSPDTLVLNRRTAGDRLVNIWYQLNQINTGPNPDEIDIDPNIVPEADAIYQSGNLNAGYDNILVNDDDLASGSIQVETERVDVIWFSGIQTSDPTTAVFPVIERGGNDNISIAAITSLNTDGTPATYGTLVGIASSDWPGSGQTYSQYIILRRQAVGDDPIPLIEIGSQVVQGVAVSFNDLGISANQSVYGYSLFASDVEGVGGAPAIAAGVTLSDISTFPTNTLSSVSGLDLVAGVSAAVASDDNLIETVGPGGYKAALATWLKANDGAFVSNGGAASTEGSNVGFWEDQAVGNHDFVTLGTAPTFRSSTSSINFNPTVDFISGAERGLSTPNNADFNFKAVNDGYTNKGINIAFRTSSTDITTKQQLYEQGGGSNGLGLYIRNGSIHMSVWNRGNQAQGNWNDDGSGVQTVSTTLATNTEYIVTLEFAGDGSGSMGGSITGYLNGQLIGSLTNPFGQGIGLLYNHNGAIGLGQHNVASAYDDGFAEGDDFYGEISEFIYCNEPSGFTLAQRQRIESYLAIKYGITLDQSTPLNYVNSAGNIIFDATTNASLGGYLEYNNDIAGIGRDDDSELDQPASRSENTGSVVTIDRGSTISMDDTWLIWGNDGAALTQTSALTSPDTIDQRLTRVWRVAERNEVLTTSVSFDITGLGLSTNQNDFSLLVASNSSNADFSNATVITGGTLVGNILTFTGVDLDDGQYFTLGTEFFFCTPGNYDDGAIMWLRADQGVTTATEGANVTAWEDQTSAGNDATNITSPIYRATTNLINDNPTVDFSTGTTGMAPPTITGINDGESTSKKFTIAFRTGNDITTKQVIYEQGGATRGLNLYIQSGVLHLSGWNQASDGVGAPWNTGTIATVNTSSIAINTTYVVTFDYAGNDAITGTITGYLNGASFGTPLSNIGRLYGHTGAIGLGDENGASLYADGTTSGASSFDGFISEISYYNQPSSYLSTDRNRIETSMAIKYGVTLDQTSPTSYTRSDGTTIWDSGVNATYNNDIAGIGRDDNACLDQKQSQSENSGSIVQMGLGTIEANNSSNTNTFTEDGDFLVWGNDGDFADQANANTSDLPSGVTERMERIWKVDDTGNTGATTITFDVTGLGYGTSATDFQLIVSNSATMASGTTTPAASYDAVTNTVTFTGVDLTDGQFFTLGTARTACGPGGVTVDLYVWLRADQGTSTTTDNTTLSTWTDQSGGNDATADGNPPLFKDNATDNINFNPTIDFDGVDDRLTLGNLANIKSGATNGGDYTVVGVGIREDGDWNFVLGSQGGNANEELHFGYRNNDTQASLAHWGNDLNVTTNGFNSPQAPFILYGEYDGATGRVIEETRGGNYARNTDANSTDISGTRTNFVGDLENTGNYNGLIPEVIVFENDISDLSKQQVYTYIALKYGITLTNDNNNNASTNEIISGSVREGDYVSSDGSTIVWTHSANTTYHNDVAGIGRDDASCWIQKQSTAVDTDDILTIGLGSVAASNAANINSFGDDRDYLVWGNDNGATAQASANTADVPNSISERMTRVWKVEDTGMVGETELQFDLTGLGYSTNASDFSLLVGNTATMADATIITGGTLMGNILSFSGIDLTDGQFFTIGTGLTTCGPGGVNTNIALWLRGDIEVFSDAGTTPAVDGVNVVQWNDQSSPASNGSEVDLTGANPVEPTFETNEFNFNPILRFSDPNSNNSSYIENGSNTVSGDMAMISVFKTGQADGTANDFVNSPALIGASETTGTLDYGMGMENGSIWVNANTTTTFDAETSGTYNDNVVHIALSTRVQSSGAIAIFVDSESVATGTGSTSALTDPTSFGIGNHSDGDVQAQFAGDIAESIVFSQTLTSDERNRVESYLAIKYGITLNSADDGATGAVDERDYRAGDGGVVWDHSDKTTYTNDIFGIGRDDLSCLNQTQSKSENSDALVTFNIPGGFSTDDSWLVSGNDNAVLEQENNPEKPSGINSRLNREWQVQETGTVGSIELTYDLSTITGPLGVGTNNLSLLRLMVDDDGDFSSGPTLISPTSIDGTNNTVTFTVNFTDGQYYTLGSEEVAALPITLVSFEVKTYKDNQVKLDWTSASETNNAFYTIERSTDGIAFESVANIDGAGNSDAVLFYSYIDIEPKNGLSFYRLKQTDFNGQYEYSEIRSVRVEKTFTASFNAYPNPILKGETLRVNYNIEEDQVLKLSVFNAKGNLAFSEAKQVFADKRNFEISTQKFEKGLNLIRILDRNNRLVVLKVLVR